MTSATQPRRANRLTESGIILLVALTAALTTAMLQLVVRGGRVLVGRLEVVGPDSIWMAPIAESVFFAMISLPFLALTLIRPSRLVTVIAVFALVAKAFFLAGLQTRWIYQWACLALAIGVAWRVASYWRRKPELASLRTQTTALALAAIFGIGTAVELFLTSDRGPVAAAANPNAPNVILLILDTVGARHLSLYGYQRETSPHLLRVASEGVTFDNAIAPSSWTLPSHASVFTGVPAYELTTRFGIGLDDSHPTLAERFAERGYRTGGFTANITYTGRSTGLSRGFQLYRGEVRTLGTLARQASFVRTRFFRRLRDGSPRALLRRLPDFTMDWETPRVPKDAGMIAREFLDWQQSATDRPFFAFLNFYDAHFPYQPKPPFAMRFAEKPAEVDRYDGGVAYMDEQLGALLGELQQRQLLEKTILVVMADHGEAFGEHGLTGHGNSLYRELVHVPLVVRYPPAVPANVRIPATVSLTDVGATLLEMTGPGSPNAIPGTSFAQLLRGDTAPSRSVLSWVESAGRREGGPWQPEHVSATNDRYALIADQDGRVQLFDWRADPDEKLNLADSVHATAVRDSLARLMLPVTSKWTPRRPLAPKPKLPVDPNAWSPGGNPAIDSTSARTAAAPCSPSRSCPRGVD